MKKKKWYNDLCTSVWQASAAGSIALSLSCLAIPTLLSYFRSSILLLSCFFMPALLCCLFISILLSPLILALLSFSIPALLSCSVLGLALTHFTFSALGTFKQVLLKKLLYHRLTSPNLAKPLYPFLTFGLLLKKGNYKWFFDILFINSRLLVGNHIAKEIDLSFG